MTEVVVMYHQACTLLQYRGLVVEDKYLWTNTDNNNRKTTLIITRGVRKRSVMLSRDETACHVITESHTVNSDYVWVSQHCEVSCFSHKLFQLLRIHCILKQNFQSNFFVFVVAVENFTVPQGGETQKQYKEEIVAGSKSRMKQKQLQQQQQQ